MKLLFFVALASPIALFLFLAWRSQATRASARGLAVAPQERHLTLAIVYLLYGSIAVSCTGLLMPPYQASDEGAHFARADQVSLGIPLGYRSGNNSGGVIDRGVMAAFGFFYPIVLHEERKATSDTFQQALKVKWQDGKEFSDFALRNPLIFDHSFREHL